MLNSIELKKQMVDRGMTQGELARAIGISPSAFSNKMRGQTCFNTEEITLICNALKIEDAQIKCDIFLS